MYILNIFFLDFIDNEPASISTNLRHSSLNSNVSNIYVKFEDWVLHGERDIHVQKIKVQKTIFRYIFHFLRVLIVDFLKLNTIRKVSHSV